MTGSALTNLKIEDFLTRLLNGLRDDSEAEAAAVLLLDEGSNELVATWAYGIEERDKVVYFVLDTAGAHRSIG